MDRFKQAKRVGLFGLFSNIFLMIIKLLVGFAGRSNAMIADGFNSAGDVFSSVITLVGNHISSKPKDQDHPYGHGKAEYIFSGIIGLSLIVVAFSTLKASAQSLISPKPISKVVFLIIVCITTIITKFTLFKYCNKVGKESRNPLVLANSQDHIADVFVSLGTIVGVACASFGLLWVDSVVGILISAWIAKAGIDIIKDSFHVLMDTAEHSSSPLVVFATKIIQEQGDVDHIDAITARPVGNRFSLAIKISVPGDMSVLQGHKITLDIKRKILENNDVADVLIHVNPLEQHLGPSGL